MWNEELKALLDSYDDTLFPEAFLAEYTLIECLSNRNGIQTFLVQNSNERQLIAKCYDKAEWSIQGASEVLNGLEHDGLPMQIAEFENDTMTIRVREYIEGVPLSQYAADNSLSRQLIVRICIQLCDILRYLHHRKEPVIHRDVKPENVIVRPDGRIVLLGVDIARIYRSGKDTYTAFFGTLDYAPPEQLWLFSDRCANRHLCSGRSAALAADRQHKAKPKRQGLSSPCQNHYKMHRLRPEEAFFRCFTG